MPGEAPLRQDLQHVLRSLQASGIERLHNSPSSCSVCGSAGPDYRSLGGRPRRIPSVGSRVGLDLFFTRSTSAHIEVLPHRSPPPRFGGGEQPEVHRSAIA